MGYIIALFLIIAAVITGLNTNSPINHVFKQAKEAAIDFVVPKSAKEILIDNITGQYEVLGRFFSEQAPSLLKSTSVSQTDKQSIQKAAEAFTQAQAALSSLQNIEKNDRTSVKSIIEKTLGLDNKDSPDPTSIPPQCHLTCDQ